MLRCYKRHVLQFTVRAFHFVNPLQGGICCSLFQQQASLSNTRPANVICRRQTDVITRGTHDVRQRFVAFLKAIGCEVQTSETVECAKEWKNGAFSGIRYATET